VLVQTVPDSAKNDTMREMEDYLRTMIRQVDSSLIEEWERMRDPNYVSKIDQKEVRPPGAEEADRDITRDTKAFTASIRTRVFLFLRGLINGDYEAALANLSSSQKPDGSPWAAEELAKRLDEYHVDHKYIRLDPESRNARHTYVIPSEDKRTWTVQQILVDPEEHNDWMAEFQVDLAASRQAEEPAITLAAIRSVSR